MAAGVVTGVEPSDADGADGADGEIVPAEALPTCTRVVLLDTGYGAADTPLVSGTRGPAGAVLRMADGAVLRMTAWVEEFATTTGAEEMVGVTLGATGVTRVALVATTGATGVEEKATGVALVATTGYVLVQGQSLIVNVVACKGRLVSPSAQIGKFAATRKMPSLPL